MNIRGRKSIVIGIALTTLVLVLLVVGLIIYEQMEAYPLYPAIEQVSITNVSFDVANKIIMVTANNSGYSYVIIDEVWVNNAKQTSVSPTLPSNITVNNVITYSITMTSLSNGGTYQVKLITIKGNTSLYTTTAPN